MKKCPYCKKGITRAIEKRFDESCYDVEDTDFIMDCPACKHPLKIRMEWDVKFTVETFEWKVPSRNFKAKDFREVHNILKKFYGPVVADLFKKEN